MYKKILVEDHLEIKNELKSLIPLFIVVCLLIYCHVVFFEVLLSWYTTEEIILIKKWSVDQESLQ